MKTLIITLTAACVVVAGYFGFRCFTHQDLGFTPARKYVTSFLKNLRSTKLTTAREAGTTPKTTTVQAV